MFNNTSFDGGSPFRIKRPRITTSGFVSDVDPTIKTLLDELNELLGKRIFKRESIMEDTVEIAREKTKSETKIDVTPSHTVTRTRLVPDIRKLLAQPLTPKMIPNNDWANDSLLCAFKDAKESNDFVTLSEYIDMVSDLSALKYAFEGNLTLNWQNLDYNTKTVLDGYQAIRDYLVAYGYHIMNLQEVNGLKNFILSNRGGAKNVVNYAIVSGARTIINDEQMKVPNYNNDNSEIVAEIKNANLSLSSASFRTSAQAVINNFVFNTDELKLIDGAGLGPLPANMKPLLVKYVRQSPIPITTQNVKFLLPMFISQILASTPTATPPTGELDTTVSDQDFEVAFFEDDTSMIQVSRSAVLCASQLYYGMVLGDELDVFGAVDYFTRKYLLRGGIEIQDSTLRDDLQLYVFSGKFTDLAHNKVVDRTRKEERKLFHRMVFNYGSGQVTEDMIVNKEFPKLWKVLMLESAKYLERAQISPNPDSFVSRQNVMQAVEDLQYNLSTHCTGMANVVTPLIYSELNFIVQRIFMHKEVLQQLVPQGSTWWRVVEMLYMGMKHSRPKATVLYNKAKLGHDIIHSIADYNPATFEDDANFSAFISDVDAFITTQSILQEALTDELKYKQEEKDEKNEHEEEEEQPELQTPKLNLQPVPVNGNGNGAVAAAGKPGGDEWDF